MKEYLKLAAVALLAGVVAGIVVGWLVSKQPAVLGNTRFPNGIQPEVITVNATSTFSNGCEVRNGVDTCWKQQSMLAASSTSCSFRNPFKASTTPRFGLINWTVATTVPINFAIGTSTTLTGTTTVWFFGTVPASTAHRAYVLDFAGFSTSSPGYWQGASTLNYPILGPDEFLNVQYGGAADSRSLGDCSFEFIKS